jgi:hypothetical protein
MFSFAGCSDSNIYDEQAAIEGALWTLLSSLNGGNLVHDVGYINNGLTASYEQLVVSNEVISMVRRITGGFEINEESLALDLIDKVGPGGEYLTSEHTPNISRRTGRRGLSRTLRTVEKGGKKTRLRANEKAGDPENHAPRPSRRASGRARKIVKSMESEMSIIFRCPFGHSQRHSSPAAPGERPLRGTCRNEGPDRHPGRCHLHRAPSSGAGFAAGSTWSPLSTMTSPSRLARSVPNLW